MDLLNSKIITTNADTLSQAQATGIYGFNTAENKLKATHVSDENELKVAISQHLVDGPDMKARTNIADSETSTFLKCDADGKLMIEATLELDSSSLAKEITLGNVFGKVALTADRTFAIMNRQLGTSGQEVQHAKVMGSEDGATTGIQHQLAVDSAGHLQVDILSGGGSSDATAANQVISQGKLDSIVSNTANNNNTANRTLLTAQNQTNGNQITNIKANTAGDGTGTATSVLVDADGHLQVDILSGGGSSDATAANQVVSQGKLDSIISNTSGGNNTANRTLLIAQNQTNGDQITKCMGNFSGAQVQLKVDTNGVLETSSAGGGGGGSTQYDSASSLPNPTVGTAILGVDSGGLANVISTDDTGKVGSVIHGTNLSGEAFPVRINQYSGAINVASTVTRSFQSSDTATIPAGTTYQSPYVFMTNVRSICIYGRTTNLTDKITLYCKRTTYLTTDIYKMPSKYDIIPDSATGDFFIQLDAFSGPYLVWGKDNATGASETIEVHFNYTD